MRALVTGATGFLGTALSKALKDLGHDVVCMVRDKSPRWSGHSTTLCFGDLSDMALIERVLAEYGVQTVFHLAAQTEIAVAKSNPVGTFEANVRGTWNVLEACRRQRVKRIIVASSDKVYGRAKPPYREDMPLSTDRPYDTSKAASDMLARTYADTYGMSVAVTRCVNLYGPDCHTPSTIIPNTIRRVLRGERPIIRNGGKMRRDFLYIDDAVNAYVKLAKSDFVGAMNFGSGEGYLIRDVSRTILKLMDSKLEPIDEPDRYGEIHHQWSDCQLAATILGWSPKVNLKDGLNRTVEWYTDQDLIEDPMTTWAVSR